MNFWLFKSEPNTWSWDDQVKKGAVGEHWDGVRNYQASNNMKKMKVGDLGFFYHSVKERRIIGIVKVIKEYYPDHTDKKNIFGMVDLVAVKKLNEFVTLDQIKNTKELLNMPLVKQSRLSVSPVSKAEWEIILKLGKTTI
jgi:predicted RNA-binding protein with PUA-like domain|tara:strand:+ start:36 stop:455 length:420 start_codon:yes stop_codon:yes gene_type:complete